MIRRKSVDAFENRSGIQQEVRTSNPKFFNFSFVFNFVWFFNDVKWLAWRTIAHSGQSSLALFKRLVFFI